MSNPYTGNPWCFGNPNEECDDCPYLKECMKKYQSLEETANV